MRRGIPHRTALPAGTRTNMKITVILLSGERCTRRLSTEPRTLLTDEGVDGVLEKEAELVEKHFPGQEFRLVPLRDGNFNFVEVEPALHFEPGASDAQPSPETVAG